jgi:CRP-like cAMP-binding protein
MSSVVLKTSPVGQTIVAGTTSTAGPITISHTSVSRAQPAKDLEGAVYAYLQAMRSLGRTHITPEDVASALGLSTSSAMAALTALKSKGVRRSK